MLIAEGSEKGKWFSISSTQERLEAIERTIDKIKCIVCEKTKLRQPGIEPGPLPWKGRILTIRPLTLVKGMTLCTYHDTS